MLKENQKIFKKLKNNVVCIILESLSIIDMY